MRNEKLTADDRNLISVIAMLIAIVAIVLLFFYARQVLAEEFDASAIEMECNNTHCKISRKDMAEVAKRYNAKIEELHVKRHCNNLIVKS